VAARRRRAAGRVGVDLAGNGRYISSDNESSFKVLWRA
jgi:hypothetical protein